MTDYTKNTTFSSLTGTPILGSEFDSEFDEIATTIATKEDKANKGANNGYCGLGAGGLVDSTDLPAATETAIGAVELATTAEVVTGTDTSRAVTPAGVEAWAAQNAGMVQDLANLADPNADVLLFWDDSAGALVALTVGTNLSITGTTISSTAAATTDASALTTGVLADGRVQASNVTQHQASLTIAESQITDGAILARLAANETVGGTWNFTGSPTVDSILVGYRSVPQNSQSGNYTCLIGDSGKHILHPSSAGAGDTFTIPANASVAYPLGTVLTFVNRDSNAVSIAITTDTLVLAGTTTTGTRSLAQNGVATAIKVESTVWIISGTGLA